MKTTKKFDYKVVSSLLTRIEEEIKKPKKRRRDVALTIKGANILKSIKSMWVYNPQGAYNGFGYTREGQHLAADYLLLARNALKKLKVKVIKPKKYVDPKIAWGKRLAMLTGTPIEEAEGIANEKIEYQDERISELESRGYSVRRQKLINKIYRENPLRRIVDEEHAQRILAASDRHNNTDYEEQLERARNQAELGLIGREDVKETARMNMS